MMFRGAYDSGFYRRARDLLHEQVTLQQSVAEDYGQAAATLDARWKALVACEREHRNAGAAKTFLVAPAHA
jgi:anaerobic magnesium-protoporphyrin IX monomethyl ester cyclase